MSDEETIIKLMTHYKVTVILGLFFIIVLLEMVFQARKPKHSILSRWSRNFALHLINELMGRWIYPVIGVAAALLAQQRNLGLFNHLSLSLPEVWLISILVLDFKHYIFHRLLHRWSWMWRFHRVHHSDLDYDLSTGFRFHPFESFFGALLHVAVITLFGMPASVVLLYSMIVYFTNFFDHANISIQPTFDALLRLLIVTPNMHRIHHSEALDESNSNFSATLSVWDRLFGTYRHHARLELSAMRFGISGEREVDRLGLRALLWMPFAKKR